MFSGAAGTSSASLGWPQPPAAGRHLSLPRLEHLLIHYFIFYLIFLPTPLGCHTRTHWKASLGCNIPQSLTAGTHLSFPRLEHTSASHGWNIPQRHSLPGWNTPQPPTAGTHRKPNRGSSLGLGWNTLNAWALHLTSHLQERWTWPDLTLRNEIVGIKIS